MKCSSSDLYPRINLIIKKEDLTERRLISVNELIQHHKNMLSRTPKLD